MRNLFKSGVLLLVLLLVATASFAQTPTGGQVDVNRLLQNVEEAQGKITSLKSTVEMNAQNFVPVWKAEGGQNFPPPPAHEIYVAAFKGKKSYSESLLSSADSPEMLKNPLNQVTRRDIFDGKQSYFAEYPRPGTENLRPALWVPIVGRATAPGVVDWMYYIGARNIADIIRSNSYNAITTSTSPEFGPLVSIDLDAKQVFPSASDSTIHVELAPAFGYAIVRQRYEGKDGYSEKVITKFSKVKGIFLPVEAENKQYTSNKVYFSDGAMRPFRFETHHFTITNLNHVPDALFVVKMKTGDIVQEDSSRYRIGADGGHIVEWSDSSTRSRKMLFGWLFMASLATLVLLGVGFLLRRRQQSRAA